jgi:hypothetical protein
VVFTVILANSGTSTTHQTPSKHTISTETVRAPLVSEEDIDWYSRLCKENSLSTNSFFSNSSAINLV